MGFTRGGVAREQIRGKGEKHIGSNRGGGRERGRKQIGGVLRRGVRGGLIGDRGGVWRGGSMSGSDWGGHIGGSLCARGGG